MGVGGIRGGGGKGRTGGPKNASGADPARKTGDKKFTGKVNTSKSVETAPRAAASSGPGHADPVSAHAIELVRKLKNGEIPTKHEAAKLLISEILEEKLRIRSRELASTIADALLDDPRLNKALDRLWSKEG
jgi:hypothetical protein